MHVIRIAPGEWTNGSIGGTLSPHKIPHRGGGGVHRGRGCQWGEGGQSGAVLVEPHSVGESSVDQLV